MKSQYLNRKYTCPLRELKPRITRNWVLYNWRGSSTVERRERVPGYNLDSCNPWSQAGSVAFLNILPTINDWSTYNYPRVGRRSIRIPRKVTTARMSALLYPLKLFSIQYGSPKGLRLLTIRRILIGQVLKRWNMVRRYLQDDLLRRAFDSINNCALNLITTEPISGIAVGGNQSLSSRSASSIARKTSRKIVIEMYAVSALRYKGTQVANPTCRREL